MPVVDLTAVPARPSRPSPADAPRRLGLTLRELREAAVRAGDVPLPWQGAEAASSTGSLSSRLGTSEAEGDALAHRTTVALLREPVDALTRRGLLAGGELDGGVADALALLGGPGTAVEIDVRVGEARARSWQRRCEGAVASLATVDGTVFELAWFGTDRWADELARVAALPSTDDVDPPAVAHAPGPLGDLGSVDLPFDLADAAAEAVRTGRPDLVPVLAARHRGQVRAATGPVGDAEVVRLLTALPGRAEGRLRALVADVAGEAPTTAGVVSWSLLGGRWHALRPHRREGRARIEIVAVSPRDLAASLAPLLARAERGGSR